MRQKLSPLAQPARRSVVASDRYKRYKLGNVKAFDSLFFPEKPNLLRILNHFENKTGRFRRVLNRCCPLTRRQRRPLRRLFFNAATVT